VIPIHATATANPQQLRWVTAADRLPARGRVRAAPGRLGALLDAAVIDEIEVRTADLLITLRADSSWRELGDEVREALCDALLDLAGWRVDAAPDDTARFAAYRDGVNAGTTGLLEVCETEDLLLAVDSVRYVARWITPELAPRRYDTRFFITAAPPGQVAHHDEGETIATIWVRPDDALARFGAGEIELLPPTIACLRSIRPFRTTAEAMAWAATVTDIVTILPIVLFEDGQVLILRPGDEGYEEALAAKEASEPRSPDEWAEDMRAARAAWSPGPTPDPAP